MKHSLKTIVISGVEFFLFCGSMLCSGFIFFIFKPSDTVPMPVFLLFTIVLFWSFIFTLKALIILTLEDRDNLPKLLNAGNDGMLIFEPSENYEVRSIVMIFQKLHCSNNFLGYGIIDSKTHGNKNIQVKIKYTKAKKYNTFFFQTTDNIFIKQTVLYEDLNEEIINKIRGVQ